METFPVPVAGMWPNGIIRSQSSETLGPTEPGQGCPEGSQLSLGAWPHRKRPLSERSPRGGPPDDSSWAKEPDGVAGSPGVTGGRMRCDPRGRARLGRPGRSPCASFRSYSRKLWLYLPKFSISGSYSLDQLLPRLGIRDLFSQQANLSGISTRENLMVSKVSGQRPPHLRSHSNRQRKFRARSRRVQEAGWASASQRAFSDEGRACDFGDVRRECAGGQSLGLEG